MDHDPYQPEPVGSPTDFFPAVPPQQTTAHPWDGLLTGPENELAFAGVQALSRGEVEGLSPLVLHGPSGSGKSRLMAGLVAEWLRRRGGQPVAHLDAEGFAAACEGAARGEDGSGWAEFRGRFRSVDLLVLEDIDGLERSPLAREELVHTLDALDARGASVAVSSRMPPGQWAVSSPVPGAMPAPASAWPRRLASRLTAGLIVRVDLPGLAARRRYVLERARACGVPLSPEAVESMAGAADGYRTLEGWIARLALEIRLNQGQGPHSNPSRGRGRGDLHNPIKGPPHAPSPPAPFDLRAMATALDDGAGLDAPRPTIEVIARLVSARFGVRLAALRGPGRPASTVEARHLAMHLARLHTGKSFAAIGAYFGGRDPATVRHACKAAADRIAADPALAAALASLGPLSPPTSPER